MIRHIYLVVLLSLYFTSFAQTDKKNQIDLSASVMINKYFRFSENEDIKKLPNGEGFGLSLQYSRLVKPKLWINSGIGFLHNNNMYRGTGIYPDVVSSPGITIIQIPAFIRYDVFRWFYFKGGPKLNLQTNTNEYADIDNQSGIGFSFAFGINLKMTESLRIITEPSAEVTSLIPFKEKKNQLHLFLAALSFKIGYIF